MVAGFRATREESRIALGEPHFVEIDSTRTFGGDEDNWGWELPTGQRLLLVLQVPYCRIVLYCDPPDPQPAVVALGIDGDDRQLEVLPTPIVDPSYSGP
jgi:hypothetical protein